MPVGGRPTRLFQGGLAMNEEYYDLQALAYEEEWRERRLEETTYHDNSFVTKDGGYTINYDEIIGWENNLTVEVLKAGDKVNYVDKQGNTIECVVLYDTNYNETNGTNYGVQIIASDVVCDVTLGYNDPTAIGNTNFEKAKYSYDNVISTLNKKAMERP